MLRRDRDGSTNWVAEPRRAPLCRAKRRVAGRCSAGRCEAVRRCSPARLMRLQQVVWCGPSCPGPRCVAERCVAERGSVAQSVVVGQPTSEQCSVVSCAGSRKSPRCRASRGEATRCVTARGEASQRVARRRDGSGTYTRRMPSPSAPFQFRCLLPCFLQQPQLLLRTLRRCSNK